MPTLANILARAHDIFRPQFRTVADVDNWGSLVKKGMDLERRGTTTWTTDWAPGSAGEFVNQLQNLLGAHQDASDTFKLGVFAAYYQVFYDNNDSHFVDFDSPSHRTSFRDGPNGLTSVLGAQMEQLLRAILVRTAEDSTNPPDLLNLFEDKADYALKCLMRYDELCKAVFEDPNGDPQLQSVSYQQLIRDLTIDETQSFLTNRTGSGARPKAVLFNNYLKCVAGIAPFQGVRWNNLFLNGVAVAGNLGALVDISGVRLIPRLSGGTVTRDPRIVNPAQRARQYVLKFLKDYCPNLHEAITPCDIEINLQDRANAGFDGDSITLLIAMAVLIQATDIACRTRDDVQVVVTGNLNANTGEILSVNDVTEKTRVALNQALQDGHQRLMMVVPKAKQTDALNGADAWNAGRIVLHTEHSHPKKPLFFKARRPQIEILSYTAFKDLIFSGHLIDPILFVENISSGGSLHLLLGQIPDAIDATKYNSRLNRFVKCLQRQWLAMPHQPIFRHISHRSIGYRLKGYLERVRRNLKQSRVTIVNLIVSLVVFLYIVIFVVCSPFMVPSIDLPQSNTVYVKDNRPGEIWITVKGKRFPETLFPIVPAQLKITPKMRGQIQMLDTGDSKRASEPIEKNWPGRLVKIRYFFDDGESYGSIDLSISNWFHLFNQESKVYVVHFEKIRR